MLNPSDKKPDPSTTSAEYERMRHEWDMITDILAGAKRIRDKTVRYLPQFTVESNEDYRTRLHSAPWRPEFVDCLRSLASKPFGKEIILKGNVPSVIGGVPDPVTKERRGGLIDDVDSRGNSLTTFARESFSQGIAKGFHCILVDYPTLQPGASVADEKAAGARPYWVQIPADNIIALYTDIEEGREVVTHIRIREFVTRRNGYEEATVEQIRIFEPGMWEVWEKPVGGTDFVLTGSGTLSRSNGKKSVPIVLFFTGERVGNMECRPPLADLAHMQIELYKALSRQEEVLTFAGFPMLAGNGVMPPDNGDTIKVGPKTILFAPPKDGPPAYWEFVQPAAANMLEIRNQVNSVIDDMRRIGMQPLTETPGGVTATGRSIDAAKAHSAVKAWALMFNDAIEQAFVLTAEYLGLSETIETEISTDFSVQPYAQFPLSSLASARATGDLSRRTLWDGLKRFDVLSPDFDPDEEEVLLKTETPSPIQLAAQETVQVRV